MADSESSTESSNYRLPGNLTLQHASKLAVVEDKPTIVDFKQANRPKLEEWVDDYKHQLGAYYLAHRTHYGPVEQGVISIATRGLQYQEFKLSEPVLSEYADKFLHRLEQFNKINKKG